MSDETTHSAVEPSQPLRGRLVLLAGGTSAAGRACARALLAVGARVVVVGWDTGRLGEAADAAPGAMTELCDLTDPAAVAALRDRVHISHGNVDGVIHLVGGWRGGGGLAGQSDEDFAVLLRSFTALRNVSRTFDDDLRGSDAGRLAIVSSTAVARPLAGGANYAAVKAASEAWARAVAQGYAKTARDSGRELTAASVIFRVRNLDGRETALASAVVALWDDAAGTWNDRTVPLIDGGERPGGK